MNKTCYFSGCEKEAEFKVCVGKEDGCCYEHSCTKCRGEFSHYDAHVSGYRRALEAVEKSLKKHDLSGIWQIIEEDFI